MDRKPLFNEKLSQPIRLSRNLHIGPFLGISVVSGRNPQIFSWGGKRGAVPTQKGYQTLSRWSSNRPLRNGEFLEETGKGRSHSSSGGCAPPQSRGGQLDGSFAKKKKKNSLLAFKADIVSRKGRGLFNRVGNESHDRGKLPASEGGAMSFTLADPEKGKESSQVRPDRVVNTTGTSGRIFTPS